MTVSISQTVSVGKTEGHVRSHIDSTPRTASSMTNDRYTHAETDTPEYYAAMNEISD